MLDITAEDIIKAYRRRKNMKKEIQVFFRLLLGALCTRNYFFSEKIKDLEVDDTIWVFDFKVGYRLVCRKKGSQPNTDTIYTYSVSIGNVLRQEHRESWYDNGNSTKAVNMVYGSMDSILKHLNINTKKDVWDFICDRLKSTM